MDPLLEPADVLKKVKEAFETRLIGPMDRTSIRKQKEVIELRKLIDKAISDAEILERVAQHQSYSGTICESSR